MTSESCHQLVNVLLRQAHVMLNGPQLQPNAGNLKTAQRWTRKVGLPRPEPRSIPHRKVWILTLETKIENASPWSLSSRLSLQHDVRRF